MNYVYIVQIKKRKEKLFLICGLKKVTDKTSNWYGKRYKGFPADLKIWTRSLETAMKMYARWLVLLKYSSSLAEMSVDLHTGKKKEL